MRYRLSLLLAGLALLPFAAGCGGGGGDANKIKIVSSLPRTGSSNAVTGAMVNGIMLALAEAGNKAGPFTLTYEDWDDASAKKGDWDPEVEAANADKAVKDPNIMAYIGTYNSGAAKIAMPVLNRAGLVMISPANSYPGLTKPGMGEANEPDIYRPSGKLDFFRVVPADDIQGVAASNWAKDLGAKSVFILDDTQLYGKGIADVFEKNAKAIGLNVAGREGIDGKAADYRALAAKIVSANPDMVYYGGITQNNAGQLWKDIRSEGFKGMMMGPDGIYEQAFLTAAGDAAEGSYFTFGGLPPEKLTGKAADWYKNYKTKYNTEPEVYAVYGYEAANVAMAAINKVCAKDRAKILDAVMGTKDFQGILGTWSFDANGDTSLTGMSGAQAKGGKFEFVKELK